MLTLLNTHKIFFSFRSGTVDSFYGPTRNIWRSDIPYELCSISNQGTSPHRKHNTTPSIKKTLSAATQTGADDWFIAGGSSGGSAVAVATGSCFASVHFL